VLLLPARQHRQRCQRCQRCQRKPAPWPRRRPSRRHRSSHLHKQRNRRWSARPISVWPGTGRSCVTRRALTSRSRPKKGGWYPSPCTPPMASAATLRAGQDVKSTWASSMKHGPRSMRNGRGGEGGWAIRDQTQTAIKSDDLGTMKSVIDTVNKAIPSRGAAIALSTGISAAGLLWISPVERVTTVMLEVPQTRLLEVQLVLSLGILGLASFVAFVLMVRAYRDLQRTHAKELLELERKRTVLAAAQGGPQVWRRSRADLLRDLGIESRP